MFVRLLLLCGVGLGLAACNTVGPMRVPHLSPIDLPDSRTRSDFHRSDGATFRLDKVVASLKRGDVIAHFPADGGKHAEVGDYCNHRISDAAARVEWGHGTRVLGDWSTDIGRVFYEVMKARGFNVVGDPGKLFGSVEEVKSAEFLVGARMTDIRGNFCQKHHWWDGRPLPQFRGEFYVKVEWEVFSSLSRRVVRRFQTEGYAILKEYKRQGMTVTFQNAFADALARFGSEKSFREIVDRRLEDNTEQAGYGVFVLIGRKPFRRPIKANLPAIIDSVVTVELGSGHGSGFAIGADGYLLTNAHVVGSGKRVPVLFTNGLRVAADVLRISRSRDVALLKVPVQLTRFLPVRRTKPLEPSDDVWVLGSPTDVKLKSTVTKGIVSALRIDDRTGRSFIQSDVAISPGNSGGPMLDSNGNVVGISVATFVEGQNLNLFIPIDSALGALNIRLD